MTKIVILNFLIECPRKAVQVNLPDASVGPLIRTVELTNNAALQIKTR